jgi:hypothetical protein
MTGASVLSPGCYPERNDRTLYSDAAAVATFSATAPMERGAP